VEFFVFVVLGLNLHSWMFLFNFHFALQRINTEQCKGHTCPQDTWAISPFSHWSDPKVWSHSTERNQSSQRTLEPGSFHLLGKPRRAHVSSYPLDWMVLSWGSSLISCMLLWTLLLLCFCFLFSLWYSQATRKMLNEFSVEECRYTWSLFRDKEKNC
jgi:hypothetical protein